MKFTHLITQFINLGIYCEKWNEIWQKRRKSWCPQTI